jgi:hypothetical protein
MVELNVGVGMAMVNLVITLGLIVLFPFKFRVSYRMSQLLLQVGIPLV